MEGKAQQQGKAGPPQAEATAAQIRGILGEIDDAAISEILRLRPSPAQVLQARTWLERPAAERIPGEFELHGIAARVFDVLDQVERSSAPDVDRDRA